MPENRDFRGSMSGLLRLFVCAAALSQLASCVGTGSWRLPLPNMPVPFARIGHSDFAMSSIGAAAVQNRGVPVTAVAGKKELTIQECRRIALSRNLELEVARLEQLSKAALTASSRKKIAPTIVYSNELSDRDNYRWGYSEADGREGQLPQRGGGLGLVTNWSYGHERTTWTQRLELKWTLTDAALAYYMTQNCSNEELKGHYKRVRVAQELLSTVDAAYFRLLSLQEAIPLAARVVKLRESTFQNMSRLHDRQLKDITDYHRANEKAVRAQQELSSLQAEALRQRNILASALGISPDTCLDGGFVVSGQLGKPSPIGKACDLELIALRNRPEAFVAGLDTLNSALELKKTIVKYFPKLTGFWRKNWDKDRYIWEKDWNDVGVMVHFDLVEWLSNNDDRKAASVLVAKREREMANVAVGIASKVRVAAIKNKEALDSMTNSDKFMENNARLLAVARLKTQKDKMNELALGEIEGDCVAERVRNIRALGEVNACYAELQGAMGLNYTEPVPGTR